MYEWVIRTRGLKSKSGTTLSSQAGVKEPWGNGWANFGSRRD